MSTTSDGILGGTTFEDDDEEVEEKPVKLFTGEEETMEEDE